jgi:hypothetical protein
MKVIRSSDCGNSPKQKLLEDISVALAGADAGLIDSLAVPELVWLHVGKKPVEGQDAVLSTIQKSGPATEVAIERVVSHGRAGAVNGIITRGGKRTAFCHMFEFNNTKCTHVKSISTYLVVLR